METNEQTVLSQLSLDVLGDIQLHSQSLIVSDFMNPFSVIFSYIQFLESPEQREWAQERIDHIFSSIKDTSYQQYLNTTFRQNCAQAIARYQLSVSVSDILEIAETSPNYNQFDTAVKEIQALDVNSPDFIKQYSAIYQRLYAAAYMK